MEIHLPSNERTITPDPRRWMQTFLAALHRRDLTLCTTLLHEIADAIVDQPSLQPWHSYFVAILHHERDADFAAAERRYRELLQSSAADWFLAGQIQISLAIAAMQMSDYASAITAAKAASLLFQQLAEPLEQAKADAQLGLAYYLAYKAGEFDADMLQTGITVCHTALDLLAPLPTDGPVDDVYTMVWNTLGLLHTTRLQWERTIHCYEQLLAICQRRDNQFGVAIAQANLGQAYRKVGQAHWEQARAALVSAQISFHRLHRPYEELLVLADLGLLYQAIEQMPAALACYVRALDLAETVRASNSSDAARVGFLATITDLFANAVLCSVQAGALAQAFAYVEQARARAFLDRLGEQALQVAPHRVIAPLSLAQVQAALPPDAVLFEYFTTGLIEAADRYTPTNIVAERPGFPRATILLFIVTQTTVDVHDLQLSPNDLYPSKVDAPVEEHFLDSAMRNVLYTYLLEPFIAHLQAKRIVYLVPHGPLHYVPFQALESADGEIALQTQGQQLIYTPSASILLHRHIMPRAEAAQHAAPTEACLAIGCNNASAAVRLHYAEDEALAIAALTGGLALVGDQPKKAALFQLASRYRLLHFSCHGDFDPVVPLRSALYLAADETLTAQEVFDQLHLRCDLVILSACASGLSRVRRGDEIYGLAHAFMVAGAPALIVTQWRVDERATHLFMGKFYTLLMQGHDPATALQQAQGYLRTLCAQEVVTLLANLIATRAAIATPLTADLVAWQTVLQTQPPASTPFADPYFWAPFILICG